MSGRTLFWKSAALLVLGACLFMLQPPSLTQATPGKDLMAYVNSASGTWYTGKIDSIDDKGLSLDEVYHAFAADVLFVSRYGHEVSRRSFRKGKRVKMLLNEDYKCFILLEL